MKGSGIATLSTSASLGQVKEFISTGFPELDEILGGGWAVGRASEVFGDEACISGRTHINFQIRDAEGRCVNSKGGSIARLYERFHRLKVKGKGKARPVPEDHQFFAPSFDEEGCIVQNRIVDVMKNGRKPCFMLTTKCGRTIQATADHEFWTGSEFVEMQYLSPGDTVMLSVGTRRTVADQDTANRRAYVYVKAHPVAGVKLVDGRYRDHRLARSRAVVEAAMNGLDYQDYIDRLNASDLEGLKFLPRETHVHHKDGDCRNDDLANLEAMDGREHVREHAHENHRNLRFVLSAAEVAHIETVGSREVYDLVMEDPLRNYVAGEFAVHNCGKSALAHRAIKSVQDQGGIAVLLDYEAALDENKLLQLGIDPERLIYEIPDHIEQGWDIVWAIMADLEKNTPDAPMLIVWDSIGGAVPKAELEADADKAAAVGAVARAMSRGCRRMFKAIAKVRAHMMWISQERHKIGGFSPFGPTKETSGGSGPKYAASQRLRCARVKTLKRQGKKARATGYLIKAITKKNRITAPEQHAEWVIDFTHGPSPELSTMQNLMDAGAVANAGGGKWRMKGWSEKFRKSDWMELWRDPAFRAHAQALSLEIVRGGGALAARAKAEEADSEEDD